MTKTVKLAQIETNGLWEYRLIMAPIQEDGTVLLDGCPKGTLNVYAFDVDEAAQLMKLTRDTIRRKAAALRREYAAEKAYQDAEDAEEMARYASH